MDTNGRETVTDMRGGTKGTYCLMNHVYCVSLTYKTGLAKLKRKGLSPFFSYSVSLNKEIISISKLHGLFLINKNWSQLSSFHD